MNESTIDEIIRNGGEFWVIEAENRGDPGTWRPVDRESTGVRARDTLHFHRSRDTLSRTFRAQHVEVKITPTDW